MIMQSHLPPWLYPPKFADERITRVADLVNILIWALITILLINGLGRFLIAPLLDFTIWNRVIVILLLLGLRWLVWQGRVYLAGFGVCFGLWCIFVYYIIVSGGLHSPVLLELGVTVVIAAILLGSRGTLAFGAICLLAVIVIYFGDTRGWLVSLEPPPTEQRLLVSTLTSFSSLTVAAAIGAYSTRNALTQMHRSKESLHKQNELLHHEIAERKRAEEARTRLANIVETTLDFVGMADERGKVIYINQGGRKLLGLADDADITQTTITDYHSPEIAKKIIEQALPLVRQAGTWTGETILTLQDKRELPVLQTILAHRDEAGNIAYYSTIIHDLSTRKKIEEQNLEFAVERERFSAFQDFLTTISHDLKTPLTTLDFNLYALERLDDPAQQKRKITSIREQTKAMQHYIRDLLALSHLEQLPKLTFSELNPSYLLDNTVRGLQSHATERQLTLTLTVAQNLPSVRGDANELTRAFNNLVENAISYTPAGGSVTVSADSDDNNLVISVADTGIGISPEALPHIFERSYRAHEARAFHSIGTDFGLAIVKKVIEIHQGRIDVQSSPGGGSTFHVYLPLLPK
jgi:PAS domain S-box-containing protein